MRAKGVRRRGVELLVAGRAVHFGVPLAKAGSHVLRKLDKGDHIVAIEADEYRPPAGIASRQPFLLIKAVVLVRVGVERQPAFRTRDVRKRRRNLALFGRFSLVEIQNVANDVLQMVPRN